MKTVPMQCECGRTVEVAPGTEGVRCSSCIGKETMKSEEDGWECEGCHKPMKKPDGLCKECQVKAVMHKRAARYARKNGTPREPEEGGRNTDMAAKKTKKTKKAEKKVAPKKATGHRPSGLNAAALVLADAGKPMTITEIMAAVAEKKLWTSKGKTPGATVYAAIIREIKNKGPEVSRFVKTARGTFQATDAGNAWAKQAQKAGA